MPKAIDAHMLVKIAYCFPSTPTEFSPLIQHFQSINRQRASPYASNGLFNYQACRWNSRDFYACIETRSPLLCIEAFIFNRSPRAKFFFTDFPRKHRFRRYVFRSRFLIVKHGPPRCLGQQWRTGTRSELFSVAYGSQTVLVNRQPAVE